MMADVYNKVVDIIVEELGVECRRGYTRGIFH